MSEDSRVKIVEVGPRDGLQNEKKEISTAHKIELVKKLADAGLKHIEAGAFVSPKWVPQMAGSADVFAGLKDLNAELSALVPNEKGMEAAIEAGVKEVAIFASASESFSQKNINCSIKESFDRFAPVMQMARQHDIKVRGYVSCVNGCPYEGEISPEAVAKVSRALMQMGAYEISLGDTIGVGTPVQTFEMLEAVLGDVPVEKVAVHMHDTYGQAMANILASLDLGVRIIDASVAGLGGCPYAKGASGNVATEDVVYMLKGMGFETGVDLDALVAVSHWVRDGLKLSIQGKVASALK
ncbi:MAG: hydroxymethylglutaryl-CoA lyase [Alphaproteobacteria bacterium]|nr:hydroxymethylglutaryl-CoA lyase [Alphaproteobacteria bacterium]